jgi:SAM-dependent methyltransferase
MAALYDAAMGEAAWPALREGLSRALAGTTFQSLADVGCGSGRVLAHLGRPGMQLVGVDRSAAMLARAARRLRHLPVLLMRQDMRRLELPHPVDLVTCTFATLNYLTRSAELGEALARMARALRPGGRLICDYIPWLDDRAPPAAARQTVGAGALRSVWRSRIDPRRGLSETRIAFAGAAGDPGVVERHVQRHWRPATLHAALQAVGLTPRWEFPLGGGGPSPWRMAVAEKPGGTRV